MREANYFVMNENALIYNVNLETGSASVLQGKILAGGPDWKNGSIAIGPRDRLREATPEDFLSFRICPKGYFAGV